MTIRTVRNLRRASQVVFFAIFFWLVLATTFDVDFSSPAVSEIRLPYPVSIALQFDPLTALVTLLANGTLYSGLLWALIILIPTIFLGRFFCGWICPFGTLNQWIAEFPSERLKRKGFQRIESNRYKKYQRIKYYIFFGGITAAIAGSAAVTLLDPLPFLARSIGTFVLPTVHTVASGLLGWVKSLGIGPLSTIAEGLYDVVGYLLLPFRQNFFHALITIGIVFLAVLGLNMIFTRFWCRAICPLGAMLGLFSRFSIFGLEKHEDSCNNCGKCVLHCQGGDNPDIGSRWHQAECHLCLNCQASCDRGSLKFKFFPAQEVTKTNPAPTPKVDVTRRAVVLSVGGGLLTYAAFRTADAHAVNVNPRLIRPPGSAAEEDFLSRCIRCGQCMRVCPNNAIHPTLLESGLEGLWTPFLIMRIGYCEPSCTLCGQVCPTGAITELSMKEKVGDKDTHPNRIGTAFIDRGRCLPWAMGKMCIVCEEWCPTSPKTIFLREETVYDSNGNEKKVKRPYINPDLCTGCGACEFACPVADEAAVRVSSVGETRSRENQILLQRKGIVEDV